MVRLRVWGWGKNKGYMVGVRVRYGCKGPFKPFNRAIKRRLNVGGSNVICTALEQFPWMVIKLNTT